MNKKQNMKIYKKENKMKVIVNVMMVVALSIFSYAVFAGPGHGHSHGPRVKISKQEVESIAEKGKLDLVEKGKIASSWKSKKVTSSEIKSFSGKDEWVVVFKNGEEKDKEKSTLYIFVSLYGQYIAANFTGK